MTIARTKSDVACWTGAAVLVLLASAYVAKGNYCLVFGTNASDAIDLQNRWREQQYVVLGRNPYDVYFAHAKELRGLRMEHAAGDTSIVPELGVTNGSQPPWGYLSAWPLVWPPWPLTRAYFASINLAAIAVLAGWAACQSPIAGLAPRALLGASAVALGSVCTATEVGQVGIVITALLIGVLWLDARGRPIAAGVLLGAAQLKPTMSGLFLLAMLFTGRHRAVAAAAAYMAVASGIAWLRTGTNPLIMLRQMQIAAGAYADAGTLGLLDLLAQFGVSEDKLGLVAAATGTAITAILLWFARGSHAASFAIAAVGCRLWTYHKSYDDMILVFLLVPLGILALQQSHRLTPAAALFVATGASLWAPGRLTATTPMQIAQICVWLTGAAFVLWHSRQAKTVHDHPCG